MSFGWSWSLTTPALPGIVFPSPPRLAGNCELRATDQGWNMRCEAELEALSARLDQAPDLALALDTTTLSLEASTNATGTLVDAALSLGKLGLKREAASATLSNLSLTVNATVATDLNGTINLSGARLEARQPGMALTTTRLDGQCTFAMAEQLFLNGIVNVGARASSGDTAIDDAVQEKLLEIGRAHV